MSNWKPVPRFEQTYEVSDRGEVRRRGADAPLSPYLRGGYPAVSLRDKGRREVRAVHIIVLEAFVGPRPASRYGAHLDGNTANPALNNLMWATQAENEAHKLVHGTAARGQRSPHAKLSDEQAEIVCEIAAAGVRQCRLARLLNVSEDTISRVVQRVSYAS